MTEEATKELITRAASILEEISDTFIICLALDETRTETETEALICANGGKEAVRQLAIGTAKRICESNPE